MELARIRIFYILQWRELIDANSFSLFHYILLITLSKQLSNIFDISICTPTWSNGILQGGELAKTREKATVTADGKRWVDVMYVIVTKSNANCTGREG
jgi:hypothetical protein